MRTVIEKSLWCMLFALLLAQIVLWNNYKSIQAKWLNVPPLPSDFSMTASFLGDSQMAYRALGIMLQSMGDEGGRVVNLADYDYTALKQWFFAMTRLDSQSDFIPYVAANYYGNVQNRPEKSAEIVEFLRVAGNSPQGEKWRFLASAVIMARYQLKDIDLALEIARELAALSNHPEAKMPNWTRQMPAFILNAKGEKEAAYAIMVEILKSVGEKIDPAEVNHTVGYICETILSPTEAAQNPLCKQGK